MKNLRFTTFAAFAVFALCLSIQAQKEKQWTYEADNGLTGYRQQKVVFTITQKPTGYEVYGGMYNKDRTYIISGTYNPSNGRISAIATCQIGDDSYEENFDGFKIKGKDAFNITEPFSAVAWRDGIKDTSTKTAAVNVTGTWDFKCCGGNYKGKLNLQQDGDQISGSFGETTNSTTGEIKGQIKGRSLTFTRTWGSSKQEYNLTLSEDGKTLTGSFSGDKDTRYGTDFKATRP